MLAAAAEATRNRESDDGRVTARRRTDVWDELLFRAMHAQQALDEAMTHLRHAEAAFEDAASAGGQDGRLLHASACLDLEDALEQLGAQIQDLDLEPSDGAAHLSAAAAAMDGLDPRDRPDALVLVRAQLQRLRATVADLDDPVHLAPGGG